QAHFEHVAVSVAVGAEALVDDASNLAMAGQRGAVYLKTGAISQPVEEGLEAVRREAGRVELRQRYSCRCDRESGEIGEISARGHRIRLGRFGRVGPHAETGEQRSRQDAG